ncbi:hypothetical protein GMSM_37190 [Geomonas sp. Red276]
MYIEMKVFGFALDGIAQMPVIILKDAEEKNAVPVWISTNESVSFAAEFVGRELSLKNGRKDAFSLLVDKLGMKLTSVVIESLKDGVFASYVSLLSADGEQITVDLHVSEAMLMSLKYRIPVMVNSDLMTQVSSLDLTEEGLNQENNARRFVDFLDQLDPSDMGKYPM